MPVHILSPDDHAFSLNRVAARIGFLELGEDVRMFEKDGFDGVALEAGDIVVGGIGFAQRAMRQLGLSVPVIESVPEALAAFAGRALWQSSMGDVRARVQDGEAIFAKPRPDRLKLFTGQVFGAFRDLIPTAHIDPDEPLDCATPIRIVAEHRCYVIRGDIVGLRHYAGDPLILPDADRIRTAVAAYADGPNGYAMDFGVTDTGETVVVEVNDGYAIGAYGLLPVFYANLIAARWEEIARTGV